MAKLDPKFTNELAEWLQKDHSDDQSIRDGAMLLLRINRNKILYQQIMRTPQRMLKKLEYELDKHLKIRMAGYSLDEITQMAKEVMPKVEKAMDSELDASEDAIGDEILPIVTPSGQEDEEVVVAKGKRPDHDKLPANIQNIWPQNAERWKKIKEKFELIKTLEEPCDRFEHLKVMKEAWYKYKEEMARYDDFKLNQDDGEGEGEGEGEGDGSKQLSDEDKRSIDNAQSYISRFLPVLMDMKKEAADPDFSEESKAKLEDLRAKIQGKVNSLLEFNVSLTEQRKADLISVDIIVDKPVDNSVDNSEENA